MNTGEEEFPELEPKSLTISDAMMGTCASCAARGEARRDAAAERFVDAPGVLDGAATAARRFIVQWPRQEIQQPMRRDAASQERSNDSTPAPHDDTQRPRGLSGRITSTRCASLAESRGRAGTGRASRQSASFHGKSFRKPRSRLHLRVSDVFLTVCPAWLPLSTRTTTSRTPRAAFSPG